MPDSHPSSAPDRGDRPEGAVAIIANAHGEVLMHLRDDIPTIAWPGYWSLLGGGCDPGEAPASAIVRELAEEAGLTLDRLTFCFAEPDHHGSGQLISFFAGRWDGDETQLPLAEGVKLQFFALEHVLGALTVPPFIRDGIARRLTTHG
ncbi:NUDIX hydrolase [Yinghuangia sp. YIM S09857]|uniref:NUDIX hydrolase n=1 Tax=Yinghuangia sp. YIM S09857 TaxID=3436929 RepID=UPI003F53986B